MTDEDQQHQSKKRKEEDESTPLDEMTGKHLDQLSDAMNNLTIQQQTEQLLSKLLSREAAEHDDDGAKSKTSSDQDNMNILHQMQDDEVVELLVGGKYFTTTKKTLLGERATMTQNPESVPYLLEFVEPQDNFFKVMFESGFGIEKVENKSAISIPDRNPDYFEYILEHLRQGGKVKTLGIEKLQLNQLELILEESKYFLTEKLSEYIMFLIHKYHRNESLFSNYLLPTPYDNAETKKVSPFQYNTEKINQTTKKMEESITKSKLEISKISKELTEKYKSLVSTKDENLCVRINVGGEVFELPIKHLANHPNCIITKFINSNSFRENKNDSIFIDRNPRLFSLIYGYLISGGKFNHFPSKLSNEQTLQLEKEAQFYGINTMISEYISPLRYPVELLGKENIELKEKEDKLRVLFAKERDSPLLDNPYLLLSPLFDSIQQINSKTLYPINFNDCPKILDLSDKTTYSRQCTIPNLVDRIETFKSNFYKFTQSTLEGLDWTGVFAAGGGVLGCCLKEIPDYDSITPVSGLYPTSYMEKKEMEKKISLIENEDDEDDPSDFGYWKRETPTFDHSGLYDLSEYKVTESVGNSIAYSYSRGYDTRMHNKRIHPGIESTITNTTDCRAVPEPPIPYSFKKSDIDLFLYGMTEAEAEEKLIHIYNVIKENMSKIILQDSEPNLLEVSDKVFKKQKTIVNNDILVVRTKYAVTFYGYHIRPIQVVLRIYKSPAEVILGFDIDCACIGYDGNQVWASPRCIRSLTHQVNLVDVDRQSTTYEYRLYKYSRRGFSVAIPGFNPEKVKNQLLQYPRRLLFSSMEHLMHGLARLLAYDFSCRAKNPKYILANYDTPSRTAQQKEERKAMILGGEINPKSDYLDLGIIKNNRYPPATIFNMLNKAKTVTENIHNRKGPTTEVIVDKETNRGSRWRRSYNNERKIRENVRHNTQLLKDSRLPQVDIEIKSSREANWKPYFIYSLNNMESILNNTVQESTAPQKIEFLQVDPGTQIGSFHPTDSNFYQDAYQKVPPERLPLLKEHTYQALWFKSVQEMPSNPTKENYISIDLSLHGNNTRDAETLFEKYAPEQSNLIEQAFRKCVFYGQSYEFWISSTEKINFDNWTHTYTENHPLYPNKISRLHRNQNRVYFGWRQYADPERPLYVCLTAKHYY